MIEQFQDIFSYRRTYEYFILIYPANSIVAGLIFTDKILWFDWIPHLPNFQLHFFHKKGSFMKIAIILMQTNL